MAGRLTGKTAIVVGAGSSGPGWGNGKAAAVLFAREGASVVCVDRVAAAAIETAETISDEGHQALAIEADVSRLDDMARTAAAARDWTGRIDILHYNVGILDVGGPVETTVESFQHVIDVNLTGLLRACQAVLPTMRAQRRGAIAAVASIAGIRYTGVPYASYSASKAAVIQFIRTLAVEHAPHGIRANSILPGLMNTPMIVEPLKKHYGPDTEAMLAERDAQCPMGHMGDAWDVAYAALYLVSDEAKYVTGADLLVDGGITAKFA